MCVYMGAPPNWREHRSWQVGFDGWRFDFVKGYGPEFVGDLVHINKGLGPLGVRAKQDWL